MDIWTIFAFFHPVSLVERRQARKINQGADGNDHGCKTLDLAFLYCYCTRKTQCVILATKFCCLATGKKTVKPDCLKKDDYKSHL